MGSIWVLLAVGINTGWFSPTHITTEVYIYSSEEKCLKAKNFAENSKNNKQRFEELVLACAERKVK